MAGKILQFDPVDDAHCAGWLCCVECGYVSVHVWPETCDLADIECHECHASGHVEVWNRTNLLPLNDEWRASLEAEMSRKVTCQMKCTLIDVDKENADHRRVYLSACFENDGVWKDFTPYTPDGSCDLMIDGETTEAASLFEEGEVYTMTFEKAPRLDAGE